jgi:hypothetical protein
MSERSLAYMVENELDFTRGPISGVNNYPEPWHIRQYQVMYRGKPLATISYEMVQEYWGDINCERVVTTRKGLRIDELFALALIRKALHEDSE